MFVGVHAQVCFYFYNEFYSHDSSSLCVREVEMLFRWRFQIELGEGTNTVFFSTMPGKLNFVYVLVRACLQK